MPPQLGESMEDKNEPRLGDPVHESDIKTAKSEINSNFRVIRIPEFRGKINAEIHIYKPNLKVESYSSDRYAIMYNKFLKDGLPLREELKRTLAERGVWTDEHEKQIENIRDKMKDIEFDVASLKAKGKFDQKRMNQLRKIWFDTKTELQNILSLKNSYLLQTVEGRAEEYQLKLRMQLCTKFPDGSLVWPTYESLEEETDTRNFMYILNEFLTFSIGIDMEIINGLPDQIIDMIGEAMKSEK